MSYLEKETDLQNMVVTGQLMEAFEKYYGENCTLVEATGDSITGKNQAGGPRVKMEQVAVKQWEGNHVIHERFYYNPG